MYYRRLGRTEYQASLLGVGGGYVMLRDLDAGTRLYQRAAELGITYFDGRYGHSSAMQRPVIREERSHFIVASKTVDHTREGALRRVDEELADLDTDYLDIFYLRAYNHDMIAAHFAAGGAVEGLLEARAQGKVRFLGLAGHSDLSALAAGVDTGLIDVVEFPLNVVRRDAYEALIPACQRHDAGMVVMKPLNAGLLPPEVALPWLANQPIHVMAAGAGTIEQLEADVAALVREPMALSVEEEAEAERWREELDARTCRICDAACQAVCEAGLQIDWQIYHNVFQNELRRLGVEGFLAYPFAPWVKRQAEGTFANTFAQLRSCTRCAKCEAACPHGLPVMAMLAQIADQQAALLEAVREAGWAGAYGDARSPLTAQTLTEWGARRGPPQSEASPATED
jgi:predicted aldo/keto reductase-like oxidoreductase